MNNLRKEFREYTQQYYGGYCNKCRDNNLEPMPYYIFSDYLPRLMILTRKARMEHLLFITAYMGRKGK